MTDDAMTCHAYPCRQVATIVMDCQVFVDVRALKTGQKVYGVCGRVFRSCDSHSGVVGDMAILHLLEFHPEKVPQVLMKEVIAGTDPYDTKRLIAQDPDKWKRLSNYAEAYRRVVNG